MRPIDGHELYRQIPIKVCLPCPFGEEKECEDCVIDKVMEVINEAPTVAAPRWRRVGEQYPNENEYVLCCIPAFFKGDEPTYEVCQYYKGSRMYGDFIQEDKCMGGVIYQNPSHWMPIEPPKEEQNDNNKM